jgi:NADP-dependent 3-hydroxy acid dehydrogenase YdfG
MHDGWADDKVVLVTGAARGIGEMTARRLHARGAKLALVGLEPDRLSALAEELGEGRAAWFEADVTDVEALQDAVEGVVGRFGGIDVAVANAGVHYVGAWA